MPSEHNGRPRAGGRAICRPVPASGDTDANSLGEVMTEWTSQRR